MLGVATEPRGLQELKRGSDKKKIRMLREERDKTGEKRGGMQKGVEKGKKGGQ